MDYSKIIFSLIIIVSFVAYACGNPPEETCVEEECDGGPCEGDDIDDCFECNYYFLEFKIYNTNLLFLFPNQ